MARVDLEPVGLGQLVGEGSEGLVGHLDDLAAMLAEQVLVPLIGEVVGRRPVAQVDVLDDAELLEALRLR